MANKYTGVLVLFLFLNSLMICQSKVNSSHMPRVLVAILDATKKHTLPYMLTCLENLEYPKNSLDIWIRIQHMNDSYRIIKDWAETNGSLYSSLNIYSNESLPPKCGNQNTNTVWITEQDTDIINLREKALNFARNSSADFVFMLDGDVFLTEPDTLKILVLRNYPIAAPMLVSDDTYSNFWLERSDEDDEDPNLYTHLIKRKFQFRGCRNVPAMYAAVLISLKRDPSRLLTYDPKKIPNYAGPVNDILVFSESAKRAGAKMKLCNDIFFGYITDRDHLNELDSFVNLKLDAIRRETPIPLNPSLRKFVDYPKKNLYSCDMIIMINLERRPERKSLMRMSFKELGMDVKRAPGVDGIVLDEITMKRLNVKMLRNYEDPYHKRPMKAGEVGCFLSHYNVWNEINRKQYNLTMVLEDDVHFTSNFRDNFYQILEEIKDVDFDLLYLGRKILMEAKEVKVTTHTTRPLYSYWTVGYILTYKGAKKLLDAKPLQKLLPVDEFIPIMFDQHPNATWKSHFPKRDLKALSANPLLIYPTHYVGMPGYISDTELSYIIDTRNRRINNDF